MNYTFPQTFAFASGHICSWLLSQVQEGNRSSVGFSAMIYYYSEKCFIYTGFPGYAVACNLGYNDSLDPL
jgi:hypothetical protein